MIHGIQYHGEMERALGEDTIHEWLKASLVAFHSP